MANTWLNFLFSVGKFLTITPPYNSKTSRLQTICTLVVVTLQVPFVIFSVLTRELRVVHICAKVVLAILVDFFLLAFSCHNALSVVLWKKTQWQKLVGNLKIIASNEKNRKKIVHHVKISFVRLVTDLTVLIVEYSFWMEVFSFFHYVQVYNAHYFEYYLVFSFNTFLSLILNVVLIQYRHLNHILQEQVSLAKPVTNNLSKLLSEIESSLFFLKDTVDLINDIFGWPLALIISYTTVYILNNLDFVFQGSLNPDDKIAFKILADTILVLLTFVSTIFWKYLLSLKCFLQAGTCVVIITCDLILREAETMLTKSYVLRRHTEMLSPKEKEKLIQFSDVIQQNFPRFSAARFFNIDRSTILSILTTVVTFLIIMIQFQSSNM
jgi:gustatory receptor